MERREVVTCFCRHDGAVLLLRRSGTVGSSRGTWDGVTGRVEGDPGETARQAVREKTGLPGEEVSLVRRGECIEDADRSTGRVVHPYLFDATTREVEPTRETSEYAWVAPTAICHRETVPGLWASYDRVRPTVETVASDRDHGAAYVSVRALEVLRDEAASVAATDEGGWEHVAETARALLGARPSMSVVHNRVNRVMYAASGEKTARSVEHVATTAIERAVRADRRAAERAATRVEGARVATLSRSGTVLTALQRGRPEAALVAASRPGGEGVGVAETLTETTAVTLTSDAAFAHALAEFDADVLVVGADTVLADGRVVNKAGTRGGALASSFEGTSVFVVAAADKLSSEASVDVGERDPTELYDGDAPLSVRNPTFDATPPDCIDAVVTERGVLDADAVREIAARHREYADWE